MRYAGSTHTYRAVPQSPPAGSRRWVMCRGMCQWSEVLQLCTWAFSCGHKKPGLSGAMQGGEQIVGDIQGCYGLLTSTHFLLCTRDQCRVWCLLGGFWWDGRSGAFWGEYGGTPGLG